MRFQDSERLYSFVSPFSEALANFLVFVRFRGFNERLLHKTTPPSMHKSENCFSGGALSPRVQIQRGVFIFQECGENECVVQLKHLVTIDVLDLLCV